MLYQKYRFNRPLNNLIVPIDISSKKILVVDDNELNVKVLSRLLDKYKANIDYVSSGDECISRIKAENHYDIIFMDDSLPQISGTDTFNILKELSNNLPPVVVLTANAISGMKEVYLNDGFSDYLSKPIDINELDRIIKKFLRSQNFFLFYI